MQKGEKQLQTIQILCVGKLKETFWREACKEYAKRLQAFCRFQIIEVPESRLPDRPSPSALQKALAEEGMRLLQQAENSISIALCIEGKAFSSAELAREIEQFAIKGNSTISFLIGSSYGLADPVKKASSLCLSLSFMTFPHQLARVMLCEQVYRSFQILHNGQYHK